MLSAKWASILAAAAFLAGCAGSGGQSLTSMMPPGGGSGLGPVPAGSTVVKVHLPWAGSSAVPSPAGRPPTSMGFPMPQTPAPTVTPLNNASPYPIQSLSLNVTGPTPTSQTMLLGAASPGCVPSTSGTVCQMALQLAPGAYTAVVTTYSSTTASVVSAVGAAQTIAFSVGPGSSNSLNLSVAAVPETVVAVPASAMSATNLQGGIDLYGSGKHPLAIEMLDGSQNIVVGGGPWTYNVSPVGGTLNVNLLPPVPSAPNLVTLSVSQASATATASLRLAVGFSGTGSNPCQQEGNTCSGNVTLDVRQLLAVANSSANTVTLYAGNANVPVATVQSQLVNPQALVFDAQGDLFVASQPGSVIEFAPPYTGQPTSIGAGVNHPQALALDNKGNLFVANGNGSNSVTEYAPPYTGAPTSTITTGIDDPVSLALDSAGDLFVANQSANTVTLYASPYTAAPTRISNGLNGPNSIAIDARGNLFVSNLNSTPNAVLQYQPPYTSSIVPAAWITNGVNEQGAIGLGPVGNLFVPNQGANTVTEYSQPNSSPATIKGGQSQPVALAVDVAGNLFVANYGNNTVTEYGPPYVGVSWTTITTGIVNPQALALSPPTTIQSF
jgi:hypothetical protein